MSDNLIVLIVLVVAFLVNRVISIFTGKKDKLIDINVIVEKDGDVTIEEPKQEKGA